MDTPMVPVRPHDPFVFPAARRADTALGASCGMLIRILDELDYGLMLVTDQAQVSFANRVALRECGAGHCMRLQDGQLRPREQRRHDDFRRALEAARGGRRSMLVFEVDGSLVSLAVVPMSESADRPGERPTLLVFSRRQVCEPLSVEFFAREHRLTSAEVAVLRGLCGGTRPAKIAHDAGVSLSTVRTQIGSVRQKTGASSIGELVRRVTMLPPIVSVLAA
ncbi:MAG TPA: LuxR C-terminal-related transcriptional regulator [Albitalea sp.]|jgi:DNA-binding CsgD family transcriptional regulator|nr:LuxR C-terminal-related transcriptional regulator [Albitalea sp.]